MAQPLIMSFRPDAAMACITGKKTQTRRIRKDISFMSGVLSQKRKDGFFHPLWRIGETVAIKPGRAKKAIGRVRITDLRYHNLSAISDADAVREYVDPPTREGYFAVWRRLNKKAPYRVEDNPLVIVIDFEPA